MTQIINYEQKQHEVSTRLSQLEQELEASRASEKLIFNEAQAANTSVNEARQAFWEAEQRLLKARMAVGAIEQDVFKEQGGVQVLATAKARGY